MRIPAILLTSWLAVAAGQPQERSFAGEIMDSQCAGMRSHARMMQGMEAKDAKGAPRSASSSGRQVRAF